MSATSTWLQAYQVAFLHNSTSDLFHPACTFKSLLFSSLVGCCLEVVCVGVVFVAWHFILETLSKTAQADPCILHEWRLHRCKTSALRGRCRVVLVQGGALRSDAAAGSLDAGARWELASCELHPVVFHLFLFVLCWFGCIFPLLTCRLQCFIWFCDRSILFA